MRLLAVAVVNKIYPVILSRGVFVKKVLKITAAREKKLCRERLKNGTEHALRALSRA